MAHSRPTIVEPVVGQVRALSRCRAQVIVQMQLRTKFRFYTRSRIQSYNRLVLRVAVWRFQPPPEDVRRCLESPEFEFLQ